MAPIPTPRLPLWLGSRSWQLVLTVSALARSALSCQGGAERPKLREALERLPIGIGTGTGTLMSLQYRVRCHDTAASGINSWGIMGSPLCALLRCRLRCRD